MKKESAEGRNAPHGPPLSSLLLFLPPLLPQRNWCVVVLYYGIFLGRTYYNAQPFDIGHYDPYNNCLARTRVIMYEFSAFFGVHSHAEYEKKSPLNANDAGCVSLPWVYISARYRSTYAITRVKFAPPGTLPEVHGR